jgi:hypothetical protein
MVEIAPFALAAANGCVPDLSGPAVMAWPAVSGQSEGQESQKVRISAAADCPRLPEVVIYEHIDFGGGAAQTSLNWYFVGDWWNDKISSIIVLGGRWRFYEHWHYQGRYWDLGPGQYRWVQDAGIPNDTLSSFQLISFC